jgi:thioesterase domain-containing protein/acyl carrier protein
MVPATFVILKSLPLTPNGKIARNKLPPPPHSKPERRSDSARPFDAIELQLAQLWRKVLGVHHVGLGDDFFELGGSSIAAARLFYEIERLTGKKLPLATLFRASTVERLGQMLRHEGWAPDWSSLIPINPGGSQLPFFLIHGAEGNVLLYRQLARYLGPDQPVYGFQSQGLNGRETVPSSIEEMASDYVKELLAVEPTGPFLLGGYCMGGTIAFEMAQQLRARGQRVGLVAMLETYNLSGAPRSKTCTPRLFHWLQNIWFHGANFCLAGDRDRWNFVREKWKVERARLGIKSRAVFSALSSSRKPGLPQSYPHLRVKLANDRAASQYQPQPYSGRVVVVRPKKGFWHLDDPTLGWSEVVRSGLVIREMSIYPRGMLVEPFVELLAQELKVCLAEATGPLARQSPA